MAAACKSENCAEHTESRELLVKVSESAKSAHNRLDGVDILIGKHDTQLRELSMSKASNEEKVIDLCKRIDSLVSTTKWLIGIMITSILGVSTLVVSIVLK